MARHMKQPEEGAWPAERDLPAEGVDAGRVPEDERGLFVTPAPFAEQGADSEDRLFSQQDRRVEQLPQPAPLAEQAPAREEPPATADPSEPAEKPQGCLSRLLGFFGPIVAAVLVAAILRTYVITPYVVPTGSMLETIQEGDMLLGESVSLYFTEPQQGDIVTFYSPTDGEILIKRVIAVAGQTIDLIDGEVYVDGEKLDEPYVDGKPTYSLSDYAGSAGITYPYTVPEGTVWVMGDNRTDSRDSRYFGPVDVDDVTSRAFLIYWPLSDFGLL